MNSKLTVEDKNNIGQYLMEDLEKIYKHLNSTYGKNCAAIAAFVVTNDASIILADSVEDDERTIAIFETALDAIKNGDRFM